jgi:hypothetical protein
MIVLIKSKKLIIKGALPKKDIPNRKENRIGK